MYLIVYLALINIWAVIICAKDKIKSRTKGKRIKEKTLFVLSLMGGSVGMYITMLLIRHKTNHKRFILGIPAIIVVQAVIFLYVLNTYY